MIKGLGTDIIEVERIQKALERWGEHFLNHVFTEKEISYARNRKFPTQHFAARFAAKEAVFKAVGNDPSLGWKDIEILNDKYGKPTVCCNKVPINRSILLSLSHTKNYAVASAIITST